MLQKHFITAIILQQLTNGLATYPDIAITSEQNKTQLNAPKDSCISKSTVALANFLSVPAIVENSVVILVIWRRHMTFTLENEEIYLIIASLSLSDMLVTAYGLFTTIFASYMKRLDSNCQTLRSVSSYIILSTHTVSIMTVCLLAIDRYIGFMYCFRYHNFVNKKNIIFALCLIWLASFSINGLVMLDNHILPYSAFLELRQSTCLLFAATIFSGALFLSAVHGHLYVVAKTDLDAEENQQRIIFGRKAELRDLRGRRVKMTVVSLLTTVSYLLTFIPIAIVFLLLLKSDKYLSIQRICGPLSFLNPVTDPIICITTMTNLRRHTIKEVKKVWKWLKEMRRSMIIRRTRRIQPTPI